MASTRAAWRISGCCVAKREYSYVRAFRVYPYSWHVYFFIDREKWARYASRRGYGALKEQRQDVEDSNGICTTDSKTSECYVGVFNRQPGTLAHEMTHAATRILEGSGVKFTANNHEALAYLVGYLVDQCWPEIR